MKPWVEQAHANRVRWGDQSWPVLILATIEELGELAQAVLEHYHEDGSAERIPDELTDLGALGYQIYWKATRDQ